MAKQRRSGSPARRHFWHGGTPGLVIGDLIQAPDDNPTAMALHEAGGDDYLADTSRTYVTPLRSFARAYAKRLEPLVADEGFAGSLYRVEPLSALEHDPDFPEGVSFACRAARILAVEEVNCARMTFYESTQAVGPYMTWADGTPIYDEHGYLLPSPELAREGVTASTLQQLGPWHHLDYGIPRELMPAHLRGLPAAPFDVWSPESPRA
jgi:hypothetical protein